MQSSAYQSAESKAATTVRWGDPVIADMEYPRTVAMVEGSDPSAYVAKSMASGSQPLNLGPWGDFGDTLLAPLGLVEVPVPSGPTADERAQVGNVGDPGGTGSTGGRDQSSLIPGFRWPWLPTPSEAEGQLQPAIDAATGVLPDGRQLAAHAAAAALAVALIVVGVIIITR